MRKLSLLVVLAVLAGLYLAGDAYLRHKAEHLIATQVTDRVPGTSTVVTIHSTPFTGHLAVGGDVPSITATVSGLHVGPFAVQSVGIDVEHLVIDRSKLTSGTVAVKSIRSGTVTATVTQAALDQGSGLPVTLGDGTVGVGGAQVPASVRVGEKSVDISVSGLRTISIPSLPSQLIPCTLTGRIEPGRVVMSCTTTTVPAVLTQALAGVTSRSSLESP